MEDAHANRREKMALLLEPIIPRNSFRFSRNRLGQMILDCTDCENGVCDTCPLHRIWAKTLRRKGRPNIDQPSRRFTSLAIPEPFRVKVSSIKGAGLGVFTVDPIPYGTIIGQYEGERKPPSCMTSGADATYVWEVKEKGRVVEVIDGTNLKYSNFLRYINCACSERQQNLVAYQYCSNIYYRTVKNIKAKQELLVWYGFNFGKELGILDTSMKLGPLKLTEPDNKCVPTKNPPFQEENQKRLTPRPSKPLLSFLLTPEVPQSRPWLSNGLEEEEKPCSNFKVFSSTPSKRSLSFSYESKGSADPDSIISSNKRKKLNLCPNNHPIRTKLFSEDKLPSSPPESFPLPSIDRPNLSSRVTSFFSKVKRRSQSPMDGTSRIVSDCPEMKLGPNAANGSLTPSHDRHHFNGKVQDADVYLTVVPKGNQSECSYSCSVQRAQFFFIDNAHLVNQKRVKEDSKCPLCDSIVIPALPLYDHIQSAHKSDLTSNVFTCSCCDIPHDSPLALWQHLYQHAPNHEDIFRRFEESCRYSKERNDNMTPKVVDLEDTDESLSVGDEENSMEEMSKERITPRRITRASLQEDLGSSSRLRRSIRLKRLSSKLLKSPILRSLPRSYS